MPVDGIEDIMVAIILGATASAEEAITWCFEGVAQVVVEGVASMFTSSIVGVVESVGKESFTGMVAPLQQ